jgi:UDP-glucose 4-epimerase
MAILITGVAGFIGANLAKTFLDQGQQVIGLDNLSRGTLSNIVGLQSNPQFSFCQAELTDLAAYQKAISNYLDKNSKNNSQNNIITQVWHLAANSDIPAGISHAAIDLRDTFMTTFNTLQITKQFDISMIAFASTSAVYGDLGEQVLTEDIGPLFPISNYGAMKLASEALISAAVESGLKRAYIFRFPNVIGIPATHGVILDFIHKLKKTPNNLEVLGNGLQQKSYLHVEDLIDAMLFICEHSKDPLNYFNIGAGDEGIFVRDIAQIVVKATSPGATIVYGQGDKGWVGDVPRFTYSIDKLRNLGWTPKLSSSQAIALAVDQILTEKR